MKAGVGLSRLILEEVKQRLIQPLITIVTLTVASCCHSLFSQRTEKIFLRNREEYRGEGRGENFISNQNIGATKIIHGPACLIPSTPSGPRALPGMMLNIELSTSKSWASAGVVP